MTSQDRLPLVLHVLEAVEGGTARHLVDIATSVGRYRHAAAVPERRVGAPTDPTLLPRLRAAGVDVHLIAMTRSPFRPANIAAALRIRRLIRRVSPAVVHGHSSVGGALGRLAAAGTGVPTVYTPNGVAPGGPARLAERVMGRFTTRIVVVSPSERDLAQRLRLADPERIVLIRNGVAAAAPERSVRLRSDLGIPEVAPLVATISRLVPQKAPERFVRLSAELGVNDKDAHFVLIGDGPMRAEVVDLVAAADLDGRFHHVAALPDASSVLSEVDVFVLASRFEGAPYTPLEAMRAGTPVVLTDVVGNRDVVEPGVSGLLVDEHDARGLVNAVRALLDDVDLRRDIGEAGRRRVAELFSVARSGQETATLYDSIAGPRATPD